jgi:hypothetical protein
MLCVAVAGSVGVAGSVLTLVRIGIRSCVATIACIRCRRCIACVGCIDCIDCVGCIGCIGCVGLRGAVGQRNVRAAAFLRGRKIDAVSRSSCKVVTNCARYLAMWSDISRLRS